MSPLRAGQLLDAKYRVEREVSRGGAGIVYAATHAHLGTSVAVKVLSPGGGESDSTVSLVDAGSFLREARLAASLRHPNVVQVLDFGIAGDTPYLVMELLEGETLRDRLRRGRLSLAELLPIAHGIAAALDEAHARGIVHRDLKPENIVLVGGAAPASVKVVDFGLACLAEPQNGEVAPRESAALVGTPAYLSPEQVDESGHLGAVTSASDRWALGVIAFECVTGRRPFEADTLGELILQIGSWPLPVPSEAAEVPPGFDAWFAKACARSPIERFPSAGAHVAALASLARASSPALLGPPATALAEVEVQRAASTGRFASSPRRWRWGAAAAAVMVLALTLAASSRREQAPAPSARLSEARTIESSTLRVAVLPLGGAADEASQALRAGLTEALIDGLAARTDHKVIALASVAHLDLAARGPDDVLARYKANRVVVGTLARADGQVTLALELIDEEQTRRWASRWTRPERELQQLGDLAAQALSTALGAARAHLAAPRDPAAYRAYLHGRFFWAKRDHASLLRAISYFREATTIDPAYARAYVGLADSYLLLPWMGPTPRAEAHERAREALGRALVLEPDSSEAHASRGNQLLEIDWRFAEAEQSFRRAIALDPRNASAHQWLAELLVLLRRAPEAEAEMQVALELEPLGAAVHKNHGKVLYYAGRFAEAEAAWRKSIELDPGQPWAHHGLTYALARLGRFDEALAAARAEPLWRGPGMAPFLAVQELWIAHLRGDTAAVAAARGQIERSQLGRVAPWTMAFVHALAGEVPAMCAALAAAEEQRDLFTPLTVVTPELAPYREEPCVRELLGRLGL